MTNITIFKEHNATDFSMKPGSNSSVTQIVIIIIYVANLGILILLENVLILVASVRNLKLRDNIYYSLFLSLSVSDFLFGVNILLYVIISMDSKMTEETKNVACIINLCLWCITLQMILLQTFCISFNLFLVISENKVNTLLWNGNRKYIVYIISWTGIVEIITSLLSPTNEMCYLTSLYGDNFIYIPDSVFFNEFAFPLFNYYLLYPGNDSCSTEI